MKKVLLALLFFSSQFQTSFSIEPVTTAAIVLLGWTGVKAYKYGKQRSLNAAFMEAVKASNRRDVRNCLKNGAHVNHVVDGQSAIHIACINGDYSIVKMLIESGADINTTDNQSRSPLIIALCGDCYKNLAVLLNSDLIESHKKGALLFSKCERDHFKPIIDMLLKHNIQLDTEDNVGGTALSYSVVLQDMKMVTCLLEAGAQSNGRDDKELTVLDRAVLSQAAEIQEELKKFGAVAGPRLFSLLIQAERADEAMNYVDVIEINNKEHNNLHWAVISGKQNLVDLLLERNASVDFGGLLGCTPIYHAVGMGKLPDLLLFISNLITTDPSLGFGKFIGKQFKMTIDKLSKSRFYINLISFDAPDEQLFFEIAQKIINQGVNLNTRQTFLGITPLHVAAAIGSRKMVNLLLQYGANPKIKDGMSRTAYDYAKMFGHKDVMQVLENA